MYCCLVTNVNMNDLTKHCFEKNVFFVVQLLKLVLLMYSCTCKLSMLQNVNNSKKR